MFTPPRRVRRCSAFLSALFVWAGLLPGLQPQTPAHPPFRVLPVWPGSHSYHPYPYFYWQQPYPYYPAYHFSPYIYSPTVIYSPYVNLGDPYSSYLRGSADVITSQGQYLLNLQQAYLLQEKLKQARYDTRRRTYEEWLWERSNLPTLNDERERIQREELRRSLHNPPLTEIWSGKALNDILASLEALRGRGPEGPPIPLAEETLQNINLTTGRGPANVGLLREAGKLQWPLGLVNLPPEKETQDLRAHIANLFAEAGKQALLGRVDAGLLGELDRSADKLGQLLAARVSDYSFSQYTEAKRFLRQLEDAIQLLRQPDAANYLTGKYAARGRTVKELVAHLQANGLRFAPATAGQESSYTALHQALVQYAQGAGSRPADR